MSKGLISPHNRCLGNYILNLKETALQRAVLPFEQLAGLGATFQTALSTMLDWLKDLPCDGQPYILVVFHKIQIGSTCGVQTQVTLYKILYAAISTLSTYDYKYTCIKVNISICTDI